MKQLIDLLAWSFDKDRLYCVVLVAIALVLALLLGIFAPLPAGQKVRMIRPFNDTIYPVEISGKFGAPRNQTMGGIEYAHTGIDYKLEEDTPLRAVADGTVIFAKDSQSGYGNLVVIDHGSGVVSYYGHLSRPDVSLGQTIRQGQLIGEVGKSGRATGYHCHFEVRLNGKPVHPAEFIF